MEHNKDQSGAVASEKPQFPWNPDPINHEWTQTEIAAIHAFGEGCFQAGVSSVQSRAAVRGEAVAMTDEEIDIVWQSMPGGPSHWLKGFGYQNFARAIEYEYQLKSARAADAPSEPSELVLRFGAGLIEVGQGHHGDDRVPAILFGRNGAGTVGVETEGDRVMLPGECIAALTFDNPESLDVVAEKLAELRARIWPESRAADALDSQPTEPDGLPPLPEPIEVGGEGWDFDDFKSEKTFSCEHMWAYARAAIASSQPTDATRYQRLRVLGAAPCGSKQLDAGNVLRFQGLDAFIDADLAAHPSRGEASSQPTDGGVRNG